MRDYIEERAIHIAQYIVDNGATVRQTARQFGVSKSTVHKDVTQRLIQINPRLAFQTRIILDINKSERHIRAVCGRCEGRSGYGRNPRRPGYGGGDPEGCEERGVGLRTCWSEGFVKKSEKERLPGKVLPI